MDAETLKDRLAGALLGCAVGDALGLPAEGMSARTIARRFGALDRYHLLGRTGFVSDDTEQSALVVQSVLRGRGDVEQSRRHFRWALAGWFLRLPFGIGLATLRACVKILLGLRVTGVKSAGNGAAMRAPVLGVMLAADGGNRRAMAVALARVTHLDARAVDAALVAAELGALCVRGGERAALVENALGVAREPTLLGAMKRAHALALARASVEDAARELGNSGYVVHSLPLALFCFARFDDAMDALRAAIFAGGDTDTTGAMVGAWLGALHGAGVFPRELVERIQDGPFGPTHLRALAKAAVDGGVPRYSALVALLRNLALYPVVLAHGFRRLWPW